MPRMCVAFVQSHLVTAQCRGCKLPLFNPILPQHNPVDTRCLCSVPSFSPQLHSGRCLCIIPFRHSSISEIAESLCSILIPYAAILSLKRRLQGVLIFSLILSQLHPGGSRVHFFNPILKQDPEDVGCILFNHIIRSTAPSRRIQGAVFLSHLVRALYWMIEGAFVQFLFSKAPSEDIASLKKLRYSVRSVPGYRLTSLDKQRVFFFLFSVNNKI